MKKVKGSEKVPAAPYGGVTLVLSLADGSIFCMIVITPMSDKLHDLACSPKDKPASLAFKLQKK